MYKCKFVVVAIVSVFAFLVAEHALHNLSTMINNSSSPQTEFGYRLSNIIMYGESVLYIYYIGVWNEIIIISLENTLTYVWM